MTKSNCVLPEEHRLPPAFPAGDSPAAQTPQARGARRITVQNALCILCALTALGVLLLAALDKLDEIRARGFLNYITEDLLSVSADGGTLGDRMSAAVFGTVEVRGKRRHGHAGHHRLRRTARADHAAAHLLHTKGRDCQGDLPRA